MELVCCCEANPFLQLVKFSPLRIFGQNNEDAVDAAG